MLVQRIQFPNPTALLVTLLMLALMGCHQDEIVSAKLATVEDTIASGDAMSKSAERKAFTALQIITDFSPPEVSETGRVRHERGAKASGIVTGDIEGSWTSSADGDYVRKGQISSGPVRLVATLTVEKLFGDEVAGTIELRGKGRQTRSPEGAVHTGHAVGQGTGDLGGLTLKATYALQPGVPPSFDIEGYIVMPSGSH